VPIVYRGPYEYSVPSMDVDFLPQTAVPGAAPGSEMADTDTELK
jgi:hypothetical protein